MIKEKYVVAYNYDFGARNMYENVALKNRNYMLSLAYMQYCMCFGLSLVFNIQQQVLQFAV